MQARQQVSPAQVNDDLLRFPLGSTPTWFWVAAGVLALVAAGGALSIGLSMAYGLQVMGYTHVQMWSIQIVNFVYWAGVSHAGILIAAILRLAQAEWRRPLTRAAELLTVLAMLVAAIFPLTHTGRAWRTAYWLFPYDFARDIWPNIRSALVWDMSAIFTYLIGSILFVYVTLIPDLAVLAVRTGGWRGRLSGALSLGFRGTSRQWQMQKIASILLPALILPVFVSDHSAVAWDFAMTIQPGWHSTIFAPYFISGAIYSGVAAVVTVVAALRWLLHLDDYITSEHFEALGRLLIGVSLVWLFLFLVHFYFGLFSREAVETRIWELRLFVFPWNLLLLLLLLSAIVLPLPLWLSHRGRRSVAVMFWTSVGVNVGMWLERYILVITPLSFKQPFVFTWVDNYVPQWPEYALTLATFALVALGILVFARLFPIIPLYDVKEEQILQQEVRIGRARVPAVIRASAKEEMTA